MSFNNLTRMQGNELAKLLMGLGRALVLASIVALLFRMKARISGSCGGCWA